jgi:hypothetical protein
MRLTKNSEHQAWLELFRYDGRVSWLTMWRRAVAAYLVWVLANVVGGAVFAFGTVLFMPVR